MSRWSAAFPDAFVSRDAELGDGVEVGPGTVVHGGVRLGNGCRIGPCCVIGERGPGQWTSTSVGEGAIIRSHTVLYLGCDLGKRLETGHHVVIREGTTAGENLRVGSYSDVEGNCRIGDYCRFHGYVHVGKGSVIGDFVWLYSQVTLLNDPLPPSEIMDPVEIGDCAVICVGATLFPGSRVGRGAFVAAGARVAGDVPAWTVAAHPDGRSAGGVDYLVDLGSGTRHPWLRHFRRGFPPEALARLDELLAEMNSRHSGGAGIDDAS